MRVLLTLIAVVVAFSGCDLTADEFPSARIVDVSTLTNLSPEAQAVLDRGGTLIWEVQNQVGRLYASQESLPASVPLSSSLFVVIADAEACRSTCEPIGFARFQTPDEGAAASVTASGDFSMRLDFEF